MKKVTTLQEFLSEIAEVGKIKKNVVFYRGHSDDTYEIKPSIYRKEEYIQNEDKIYKEVIARVPNQFEGKTTIEALTMMQHYDVPTRILDITSNPLVALYFACQTTKKKEEDDETDAEVLAFDIPENNVCFSDSDRVTILANLAKCDKDFYFTTNYNDWIEIINEKIREIKNKKNPVSYYDDLEFYRMLDFDYNYMFYDYIENKEKKIKTIFKQKKDIDVLISTIEKLVYSFNKFDDFIDYFEYEDLENLLRIQFYNKIKSLITDKFEKIIPELNEAFFDKLLHHIREDKSYFQPKINPNDVMSVLAVKPKLNNPRIIRQQGAFLIFGIDDSDYLLLPTTKPMAKLNQNWILRGKKGENSDNPRIIIAKNSKKNILKELDDLGINQATLFPEIDKVGAYIKGKFEKKTKDDEVIF